MGRSYTLVGVGPELNEVLIRSQPRPWLGWTAWIMLAPECCRIGWMPPKRHNLVASSSINTNLFLPVMICSGRGKLSNSCGFELIYST